MDIGITFKPEKPEVIIYTGKSISRPNKYTKEGRTVLPEKAEFSSYERALCDFRRAKEKNGKYSIRLEKKIYELDKEAFFELYKQLWNKYSCLVEEQFSKLCKNQCNQHQAERLVELLKNIGNSEKELEKVSGEYEISVAEKRLQCLKQKYTAACECRKVLEDLNEFYGINKCLMHYLAYFAGCSSAKSYHLLASHIRNDTRSVVITLQKNSDSLHNLEQQLQAYEQQYREWNEMMQQTEDSEYGSLSEYLEKAEKNRKKLSEWREEIVKAYERKAWGNYEELQKNVDDAIKSADTLCKKLREKMPAVMHKTGIGKAEELYRECENYQTELLRLEPINRVGTEPLIYLKLLVKALPLLWQLEESEIDDCDCFTAENCWEEYRDLVHQLLADFNKETKDAYFEWADAPENVANIADEKRHLCYEVSDAAWPCLFVNFPNRSEPIPLAFGGRLD